MEWPGKVSGRAPVGPEAAVSGPIPMPPVLESHQPGAALHCAPGWEGLTLSGHIHLPFAGEAPSLGLSGFSLRLGATVPSSPGSGG